ncbi:TonB-dependent receptor [Flaviaesturariibacter amylovorans]|uniref:Carboxypeptidase regulatory-like domain-containing protein n=1 Tax=Flaviaesturariibacter amylovorans TaxID=1084520 RepID=A0ABP8GRD3_9BACT
MRLKTLLSVLLILFSGLAGFAQETTSEINGVVRGDNRSGLEGATITATHLPTGTVYRTLARKDGRYNLPNVRVGGPYDIQVSYVGYQAGRQTDVVTALGTAYKADFALVSASGGLSEVTVVSTRGDRVFSRSRTGASEVITRQQLDRLPTINRSIQDFTRLTPSANGSSFAGRSGSYNNLTVNGASFNNTFGLSGTLGGQTNSQPISIDALDQIQVNIAPYDVTLGSFTGAGINSVTKSGTNDFRGSLYYYWKSPDLTGTKVGTFTVPRQQFDFNNRGVTFGGPIIRNKLFFFVSGEQQRESTPATSFTARRGSQSAGGNVSQARGEQLDSLRTFLIDRFNYDPGAYENYNFETYSDKVTTRVDWNINTRHSLNVNYYYLKSFRNVPPSNSGSPAGGRQASNTALPFFAGSYVINNDFNIVIAELNSRFGKWSNKLQVGYNRLRDYRSSPGGVFPFVDIENNAGASLTSFGYEPFTAFNTLSTDTWQFNDIVSVFKGKHTLTFGTQNTYNKFRNGFAPNYYGAYRFRNIDSFYNAVNTGRPAGSRYELRYSARKDGAFPYADIASWQLGFFAQDRWNVTNNFTLTAGLRADIPIFEDIFNENRVADSLTWRRGVRIQTGQGPKTSVLWSPRVGFNWDVDGNKKTQLRGGLGIFAGAPPFVWISNQASNNGVDFGSFVRTTGVTFDDDVNAYRPANAVANTQYNLAITDRNFKFPQVFRTNVAVDRKIFWDITATLEGIYTKDINAVYHQNINLPDTSAAVRFRGPDNRFRFNSAKIYSGAGGATLSNPDITDAILMTNTSKGYSYNITLQLQRNVNNLYTMIAYTYGDSRSVNDGGSIAQSIWRDRFVSNDPNENTTSFSSFYQPHRVVAAAFYRKEYKKYFATSLGFTFEAANGGTASYVYSNDLNNDGQVNDLIYVPRDQSEILLVAPTGDTRSAQVLWNQLNTYINQDPYLSTRRGQYAERNGLLLPFYKRLDLNFTQDFMVKAGKYRNILRFTADIFNFGNLLNKNWGTFRTTNRTGLLRYEGIETAAGPNQGKPRFSYPYLDAASQIPLTSTFQSSTGQGSRYQIQLGLRYIFNN